MTLYLNTAGKDRTQDVRAYLNEKRRYRARAMARFMADVSLVAPLPPKNWTPPTPAAPAVLEVRV